MKAFMELPGETLRRLGVSEKTGLTMSQAEESRERYGKNIFTREKPKSLARRVWEAASEPMLIMLIIAGIITLGVNVARAMSQGEADFLECAGIFAAIALSVVITVIMEGKSAKAFETLSKIGEDTLVKVIREGECRMISQKDIVVGDILCAETGDKLCADARLIESMGLTSDESSLTGESVPVKKDAKCVCENEKVPVAERNNMLYSGSFITGGNGKAVVIAVGDHTEFGKIAKELSKEEKGSTPLQEKMAVLGTRITILGAVAAAVVFILQLGIFLVQGTASLDTVSEAFITSIVLIVAAVPEGLPTIVAVSLAVNIIKMSKQNALVKKMIACETVGCINVICSDKTGTLTQNKMTVTDVCQREDCWLPDQISDDVLLSNFCINSTADIRVQKTGTEFIGNPTECALLVAADKAGKDYLEMRNKAVVLYSYPFCSENKNMTTVIEDGVGLLVYTKGSPEKILSMCRISAGEQQEMEDKILNYQKKACRVIAFAHKKVSTVTEYEKARTELESEMSFDGFAVITDPLRQDVYDSVKQCKNAGIELKMLTGDNIITAKAIADELHLLDGDFRAVQAREIEEMSDKELAEQLPKIRVIARSTPVIKMRVVRALKAKGNVVAVTGDGINDAPAIKSADVGVSMGIAGTEVSKEASDIVLLDDSFSTIVKAVKWGRGIYENFQRFIQFQLTVNLSSVIVVLVSILSGFAAPFTALQLLWINIIMDGPPALTLGLEPIRSNMMERKPTRRDASIVSKGMLFRIVVNGIYISVIFMLQHWFEFLGGSKEEAATILFTLFVVFQLFNAFNSREMGDESVFKNVMKNKLMLGVFLLTFGLQIAITQFGGAFFGTVPLSVSMWIKMIGLGFTVVLVSEAIKLVKRSIRKIKA